MEFNPIRFRFTGTIQIEKSDKHDVTVTLKDGETQSPAEISYDAATKKVTYSGWISMGQTLDIVPSSPSLLFYPKSRQLSHSISLCPQPVEAFQARPGLYWKGSLTPSVSDVDISVFIVDGTNEEFLLSVKSDTTGHFSVGPLYDNLSYKVTAKKENYAFTENNAAKKEGEHYHFDSYKLGKVTITVKDQDSNPVQGVLLSLSGSNYRKNNVTSSNGVLVVNELLPGDYYLKPLLKEYVFEPASQTVKLGQGQDTEIVLKANRVAYSCYGNVLSLNGEPEKVVVVEAVGPNGEIEEGQTDNQGVFRIRGLQPSSKYTIRVKQNQERIERATPAAVEISVGKEDVQNINFILFRRNTKFDLTGVVKTSDQFLPSLQVALYKEEDMTTPLKTMPLGHLNFFEFSSLGKGTYVVKLTSSLSTSIYKFSTVEKSVSLNNSQHLTLDFVAATHQEAHDITPTPFFGLIFGLGLLFVIYNWKSVYQMIQTYQDTGSVRKPTPRRTTQEEANTAFEYLPKELRKNLKSKK